VTGTRHSGYSLAGKQLPQGGFADTMQIYRQLGPFLVHEADTVREALAKIESNKHKIVYVVDEHSGLLGCFGDGDYRRWSLRQERVDLESRIIDACNRSPASMPVESGVRDIEARLSQLNSSLPLVDEQGHIVALVEKGSNFISIGSRRISDEDPVFVIAEIGNNHQGSLEMAKQLVDHAVEAGVDCVKFQMRSMDELYGASVASGSPEQDLGSQYTLDLLEKFQLQDEDLFSLFDYCAGRGVIALCTPWDIASLDKLEGYGLPAYKIASADLTNFHLLHYAAETGKPLICSTGMSSEDEIRQAAAFLEKQKAQFIFLHCNSTYPTPYKDINLGYLGNLKEITRGVVGYSGHERGYTVALAAVSLGAKVIEKHLTVDRELEGNDHKVSLLPDEMSDLVREVRKLEEALGAPSARQISQGEMINREVLAKSLFAVRDLAAGAVVREADIAVQSPGKGLQPNRIHELIGRTLRRDIRSGTEFFESDIHGGSERKAQYAFDRPYGIPVRYHDFKALTEGVDLDFVEFHLSYKDLDVAIDDYVAQDQPMGLAVHAPELFAEDHLLDLAATDSAYRAQSIAELQRVVEHTRQLAGRFPATTAPTLVVNCGGWNDTGFVRDDEKAQKYELVERALGELDLEGVTLAIQTMPPFPWHFGGQSYHNLFVLPDEIAEFCARTGFGLCLDISHSMMACNYYQLDLYEFTQAVGDHVIHLHIVDADGVDGEGVQIGHGDIDFKRLGEVLTVRAPGVPFIPEVWQGHTENGAGFWQALEFLERKFAAA